MSAEYYAIIRTAAGVKRAVVSDFVSVGYQLRVNAPGLFTLTLRGDHSAIDELEDKGQIEVWRSDAEAGITPYIDFHGMYRSEGIKENETAIFTAQGPGQLAQLGWRHVCYYAETLDRSKFVSIPAETIMKTLVEYNAGASALVSNGRYRDGTIDGITVQTDEGRGNILDWACANTNLLETLQNLATVGGADFNLVKTAAATWDFHYYPGQLGTDRSNTVLFALERSNITDIQYIYNRIEEKTVAVVGGQGDGSGRAIVVRYGDDYAASNDIETFVDARSYSTTAGLEAKGDQALYNARARKRITFRVRQTEGCRYGRDYFLGDLVNTRYRALSATRKITGISVTYERGAGNLENIGVEVSDV